MNAIKIDFARGSETPATKNPESEVNTTRISSELTEPRALPSQLASLADQCPYCHCRLDGLVFCSFLDGVLANATQTKRVGLQDYTWIHTAKGCVVPQLQRLGPVNREVTSGAKFGICEDCGERGEVFAWRDIRVCAECRDLRADG